MKTTQTSDVAMSRIEIYSTVRIPWLPNAGVMMVLTTCAQGMDDGWLEVEHFSGAWSTIHESDVEEVTWVWQRQTWKR